MPKLRISSLFRSKWLYIEIEWKSGVKKPFIARIHTFQVCFWHVVPKGEAIFENGFCPHRSKKEKLTSSASQNFSVVVSNPLQPISYFSCLLLHGTPLKYISLSLKMTILHVSSYTSRF